ncbi:Rieske 2Fe-2S domain-containing protein [Pimelobacter simplex]|uniref:Rieske-type oxygenase n=1 Tax=Nocardioides simplex TaxID=2045 RepID=A0A0A1DQ50_NOCSI|nr:Rieske 2Fe-2S domain-containing protein [Pimelobacter simplex]AIY19521.1 3-ketosteroid-9-alpha-hydroxylase, subunit A KshA [Pimelobacter simplex]MCG8150823.1 Rieske 2Fe-2S domain-containing protein [Pimelobacter simplex]GEB15341.1 putative oxygenase [Pimelobacter simplex]SFM83398.1 3-ketosteroid 9alpha-monooxygenase subunit A [Pimelobacter simplex]
MTTAPDIPRQIEADPIAQRYARGWHCLGLSQDFRDGQPHQVLAFGTKLVVWEDSDGELRVLDAFCRHMGGDLSQGTVKDGNIACPFHDWRWGGDGRCKQIPYSRRVPLRARTSAWPTLDQDGMLFVWNDPQGNPPIAEQAIPKIPGASSDEWTDWHWYSIKIDGSNCREIVDNVVDMAHFFYVHYSMPTYFKNIFEGHVATQVMNGTDRGDVAVPSDDGSTLLAVKSTASYFGPSFMIDDLVYEYDTGNFESILINCHYPVDTDSFVLQYGIIVKKPQGVSDEYASASAATMGDFIKTGFEQDVAIWQNKARIDNPLLCEEDGPVYQLRRWYQQFYTDVDAVLPEMTERFEFELDMTRPAEAWSQEVAENIARAAENESV